MTQADQQTPAADERARGPVGRATADGRPTPTSPVTERARTAGARGARPRPAPRRPRSARLVLRRVEPLSVLRISLLFALAAVIVAVVLVSILYGVLHAMGVFDTVGSFTNDVGATSSSKLITYQTVVSWTAVVSAILAIFGAALATVAAYIYNGVNEFVGGPEITFTERS